MAHILVVDDDELVAERAAQVLIDVGHACGWVGDAESAMRVIQRRRPDLLLVSEQLPGECGTSFLRRLRQSSQFYDLPVIMMTRNMGYKEEQIAYFNGAQDYIRKPLSEPMLQFRVRELLENRRSYGRHKTLSQNVGFEEKKPKKAPVKRLVF